MRLTPTEWSILTILLRNPGKLVTMTAPLRYLLAAFVGAVLVTKELERRGALHCDCPPECWCHQPGASLLRWVLPIDHACRPHQAAG